MGFCLSDTGKDDEHDNENFVVLTKIFMMQDDFFSKLVLFYEV